MAVNDPTIVFAADVVNNGNTERTPGSGVEEILLDVGLGNNNDEGTTPKKCLPITMFHRTASEEASFLDGNDADQQGVWFNMKMVANNANHWKFTNRSGSTLDFTFSVMEIG